MKKVSYYLVATIFIGIGLVSFWAYQKYFKQESPALISFSVERGNIQEAVRVRGEVTAKKKFDLEFPFAGTVESVLVKEGQLVAAGTPLIKLETTDFELEIDKIKTQLAQAEASLAAQKAKLAELKKGARPEEIKIQEAKVSSARVQLNSAKKALVDKLQDAYIKADNAVRNEADQVFKNPQASNPEIKFLVSDNQLKLDAEWQRRIVENILTTWQSFANQLSVDSDLDSYLKTTKDNLNQIKLFLDKTSLAINDARVSLGVSQLNIDTWRAAITSARTTVSAVITGLLSAEEKFQAAQSNLALAQRELTLTKAGATAEQIEAQAALTKQAEANVSGYRAQLAIFREKIKKSTLYSPAKAKVVKIWLEKGEFFQPGRPAVSLFTPAYKIQADVSELEIGKIRDTGGNEVAIRLDAFPETEFQGRIISVEPQEIIKDGDKYYRINVELNVSDEYKDLIRSGMSADLTVKVLSKENVLKVPELAIYRKNDRQFVKVLENGLEKEVEIQTGISDGESVEVVKGLREGQTVVISAD